MRTRLSRLIILLIGVLGLSSCGYNTLQQADEQVKAAWSEVLNQYQRRADLVPNLVNVVKGYASHEREVLTQVTQARAQVGQFKISPELINDPEAFQRFQQAQAQLHSALSRLISVSERYPDLKANTVFRDLQAQLEGTENRIAVARGRYIQAVQQYNILVRSFPSNLTAKMLGMTPKPNFSVENEAELAKPPQVNFDSQPAPASP
jgi:LemA protein